jgi:pyruvate/2-oxoglutarate dehydrogenase complex dihydrolipoamide acyltransferase (E2) component
MPKLGYDMTSGSIVSWLVSVGDGVSRGQAIAEIETDKVVIEMESFGAGTLIEIVYEADEDVEIEVGEVIGYLEDGI